MEIKKMKVDEKKFQKLLEEAKDFMSASTYEKLLQESKVEELKWMYIK